MRLRKTKKASVISSQQDWKQPKLAKNPVYRANDIGKSKRAYVKNKVVF